MLFLGCLVLFFGAGWLFGCFVLCDWGVLLFVLVMISWFEVFTGDVALLFIVLIVCLCRLFYFNFCIDVWWVFDFCVVLGIVRWLTELFMCVELFICLFCFVYCYFNSIVWWFTLLLWCLVVVLILRDLFFALYCAECLVVCLFCVIIDLVGLVFAI